MYEKNSRTYFIDYSSLCLMYGIHGKCYHISDLSLLPLPDCTIVVCDFEHGRLSLQISRFDTILEDKILSTSDITVHFFHKRSAVEKHLGFVWKVLLYTTTVVIH